MNPRQHAHASLDAAAHDHTGGHRCTDGDWWNEHAGRRQACPTLAAIREARTAVEQLAAAPHDAAHDDAAMTRVAEGMTGLDLSTLTPDAAAGWLQSARDATEALCEHLERDPATEARLQAVRDRLATAGAV